MAGQLQSPCHDGVREPGSQITAEWLAYPSASSRLVLYFLRPPTMAQAPNANMRVGLGVAYYEVCLSEQHQHRE